MRSLAERDAVSTMGPGSAIPDRGLIGEVLASSLEAEKVLQYPWVRGERTSPRRARGLPAALAVYFLGARRSGR